MIRAVFSLSDLGPRRRSVRRMSLSCLLQPGCDVTHCATTLQGINKHLLLLPEWSLLPPAIGLLPALQSVLPIPLIPVSCSILHSHRAQAFFSRRRFIPRKLFFFRSPVVEQPSWNHFYGHWMFWSAKRESTSKKFGTWTSRTPHKSARREQQISQTLLGIRRKRLGKGMHCLFLSGVKCFLCFQIALLQRHVTLSLTLWEGSFFWLSAVCVLSSAEGNFGLLHSIAHSYVDSVCRIVIQQQKQKRKRDLHR